MAVTGEGHYTSSRGGLQSVMFRLGSRAFPFEQFDLSLNRPDLVYDRLGYVDHDLIGAYEDAYRRRVRRMGFVPERLAPNSQPPDLALVSPLPPAVTRERRLVCRVRADPTGHPLDRLLAYVNDVPVLGRTGIPLHAGPTGTEHDLAVTLSTGDNRVQVSVLDTAGAESLRETFVVTCTASASPTLYVLAVGVSLYEDGRWNLTYANKDARDLAEAVEASRAHFEAVRHRVRRPPGGTRGAPHRLRSCVPGPAGCRQTLRGAGPPGPGPGA